jgi:hypothetical protein
MGGAQTTLRVVCCQPELVVDDDDELSMELSEPVAAAIEPAVQIVELLIAELAHA